jgi:hypothetical protein
VREGAYSDFGDEGQRIRTKGSLANTAWVWKDEEKARCRRRKQSLLDSGECVMRGQVRAAPDLMEGELSDYITDNPVAKGSLTALWVLSTAQQWGGSSRDSALPGE